jgi:hypothetical protein
LALLNAIELPRLLPGRKVTAALLTLLLALLLALLGLLLALLGLLLLLINGVVYVRVPRWGSTALEATATLRIVRLGLHSHRSLVVVGVLRIVRVVVVVCRHAPLRLGIARRLLLRLLRLLSLLSLLSLLKGQVGGGGGGSSRR